jgi:predicted RNase H-like HicB family nuclease
MRAIVLCKLVLEKNSGQFNSGSFMSKRLTAIIQAEPPGFVALCPELDVASQGDTVEQSLANLREAIEFFYECASAAEISAREGGDIYITQLEVSVE